MLNRPNMPFCEISKYQNGVDATGNNGTKIFYRTYGQGPVKVLLIIGILRFPLHFFFDVFPIWTFYGLFLNFCVLNDKRIGWDAYFMGPTDQGAHRNDYSE